MSIPDFQASTVEPSEEKLPRQQKGLKIEAIDFEEDFKRFIESLDLIKNPKEVIFYGNKKGRGRVNKSARRSSYIGVCKNGPHWQALIAINHKKTYIGTYISQKEAAKAYDYYCMLIHCFSARTNFRYTKEQALELVHNFKS